jgi:RND superfamily putative drug exporter
MLESIARFCFHRYRIVIALWIVAVIGFSVLNATMKPEWLEVASIPKTESAKALKLLEENMPEAAAQAGEHQGKIVFQADDGIAKYEESITKYLNQIQEDSETTKIVTVTSPFDSASAGQISQDGTVAFATVGFDEDAEFTGIGQPTIKMASELREEITVEFGGVAFASFEFPASELIGILAALVILLIAFGSLVAAGLPIVTALFGIAVGIAGVGLWTHVTGVPEVTVNVAAMIGIGVGIDYALFIVTRYREALKQGHEREAATVEAMTTSGAAVLFAGLTVVISLLGMLIIGLDFTTGMALGTSTTVFVMIIAALTFVPALLGSFVGKNLDKFSLPHRKTVPDKPVIWVRWSEFVQRHAWSGAILGASILIILSIPLLSLRVGVTDEGNGPEQRTTKQAYDILAEGFGPGFNGPLLVVVDKNDSDDTDTMIALVREIETNEGVAAVVPSSESLALQTQSFADVIVRGSENVDLTPAQQAIIDQLRSSQSAQEVNQNIVPIQVFPTTSPQSEETTDLIHQLRDETIPEATEGSDVQAYVSGLTAANLDFAEVMSSRIPWFIGAVLALSFLLLMAVFRSILVPTKAVIMNLLSIGAAYGVVIAVFQWGWVRELFGVGAPGPIEPWAPMMLFAIVFGLSMDYEVFLLSKIKEEYDETKDNATAVTHGLASTARVITSAALIMVCVFGSFILADDRALKLMGLGLAVAVLLDATIVRMLLVPATMELLGDKNWWFPKWLDRIVPKIHVDGVKAKHADATNSLTEDSEPAKV